MGNNEPLKSEIGIIKPAAARATYYSWKDGVDPKLTLTKPTFYHHRLAILNQTGVDISQPYQPVAVDDEVYNGDLFKDVFSVGFLRSAAD